MSVPFKRRSISSVKFQVHDCTYYFISQGNGIYSGSEGCIGRTLGKHHKERHRIFLTFFFRYIVSVTSPTSIEILHKVCQGAGFLANVKKIYRLRMKLFRVIFVVCKCKSRSCLRIIPCPQTS